MRNGKSDILSVLCVYDDPIFLDRICRNPERGGDLFVEISVSVEDALHLVIYVYFDVVVTDGSSWKGEENGFLKAMRKQGNVIPLIYFIRSPQATNREEARTFGRVRFLVWDEGNHFPPFDQMMERCIRDIVAPDNREDR